MSENANYKNFKSFIFTIAKPYLGWFFAMFMIGLYSSIHSVMQPYVLKILIDKATHAEPGKFLDACLPPGIVLIALGFIITIVWRFYNYIVLKSLPKMRADIIKATTSHLRGQSFGYFQDNLSGSISAKVSDLTNNIQNIVNAGFNISRQGLTIIFSVIMAGLASPSFSLIFFIISIAFIFIAYYCSKSIKSYARAYAEAHTKNIGNIVDCFSNVLNMFLFSREKYEAEYLQKTTAQALEKDKAMQFKNLLNASLLGGFAWLLNSSSIVLLLYLGDNGKLSIGDFAYIFILSIVVIEQIWNLTENLLAIGGQIGICEQAIATIFVESSHEALPSTLPLKIISGEIIINKISFGYNLEQRIIDKLSVHISGGTKVGLVGYSGAGKSTLVQLITRLFDVEEGEILIDKQNILNFSRQALREKIAFIPQVPSLFNRSIYENILYGDVTANYDAVIEASKKAYAYEFIKDLPEGYNAIVGERGLKLSGGQRQRIAIARAILKNAPILILDEATSSLDSITEQFIQASLKIAMQDRTVIVIAHRLSTILNLDKILVMDNGKIVEMGTHQELISKKGFYKALWDTQSGHSFI